jgi:phosphatidylglycerophosphatase A
MTTEGAGPTARTSPRTVKDRIAWIVSIWFGCGLVPRAPGTAGTIGAVPLYLIVRPLGLWAVALAACLLTVVGIWASSRVARICEQKDPQFICVDEVAGVFVTFLGAPAGWKGTLLGVLLFRLLDCTKPFPARACEKLPGGYGIVLDDVAAGLWGALMLVALHAGGWI